MTLEKCAAKQSTSTHEVRIQTFHAHHNHHFIQHEYGARALNQISTNPMSVSFLNCFAASQASFMSSYLCFKITQTHHSDQYLLWDILRGLKVIERLNALYDTDILWSSGSQLARVTSIALVDRAGLLPLSAKSCSQRSATPITNRQCSTYKLPIFSASLLFPSHKFLQASYNFVCV